MIKAVALLFYFLGHFAVAASVCIKLEGIEIGCVPSQAHTCFMNKHPKAEGSKEGECLYAKSRNLDGSPYEPIGVQYQNPEGAIDWQCSAWETKETCQTIGDQTICTTSNLCKEYSNPTCKPICVRCYKETEKINVSNSGCIICTRPHCPDEPGVSPDYSAMCPLTHPTRADFVRPKMRYPTCGNTTPMPCPTTASHVIEATGEIRQFPVTILPNDQCNPPNPNVVEPVEQLPPNGENCPWITDPRGSITNDSTPEQVSAACAIPPAVGNRFPIDCCGCTGNRPAGSNPTVPCASCAGQTHVELGCPNPN